MKKVKILFKKRIDELISKDKDLAENTDIDNNNIKELIIIGFMFKIGKLVITLFNISFFIGFGWYIISKYNMIWSFFMFNNIRLCVYRISKFKLT